MQKVSKHTHRRGDIHQEHETHCLPEVQVLLHRAHRAQLAADETIEKIKNKNVLKI
jgi:hypothetical protein